MRILRVKKIKLLIFVLLLFLFLGASFVLAQKPLEITYPEIPGVLTPTTTKTALPDYIRYIFQLSLFIGALIAFGSLIYGGARYLTSAGKPAAQKDAKSQITAGSLGLLILISAFLILNTVSPQLVALKVSLPEAPARRAPLALRAEVTPKTHISNPFGGLIENLWGKQRPGSPAEYYPQLADCYQFDGNGNPTTADPLENQNRLDCIKWLSKAIQTKAENLKKPVEELQKLYSSQNCCRDCCANVCQWLNCSNVCELHQENENWWWENCEEGYGYVGETPFCEGTQREDYFFGHCGNYQCCERQGMERQYNYQLCPYNCCEFFEECECKNCGFEDERWERTNSICIKEDEEGNPVSCNPAGPNSDQDTTVCCLLYDEEKREEKGCAGECEEIMEKLEVEKSVEVALKELILKLGLFPLMEKLEKGEGFDQLLSDQPTKNLISELLIGEPPDPEKLKEFLGIPEVMGTLIGSDGLRSQLLSDQNIAKTILKALGLLKNEVAINEIAWMGTLADENDEWIELYNNTKGDINLDGWKLKTASGSIDVSLSGVIPAQGFYLLENNETATSEDHNLIYSGNLADSGEKLELYDQFGNLIESVDCSSGWFAGDPVSKTSMERINPTEKPDRENWATNSKELINGEDSGSPPNPIYGTPKQPNSAGVEIISYPAFNDLVEELQNRLRADLNLREKLILILREEENLEQMIKSGEALKDILIRKEILKQTEILRILLERKGNLDALLNNCSEPPSYARGVFEALLEIDPCELDLKEARTNLKLINEFKRDLDWVIESAELMRECEEDPISIDNLTVEEERIATHPEWKEIESEAKFYFLDYDPATFYCHKGSWER